MSTKISLNKETTNKALCEYERKVNALTFKSNNKRTALLSYAIAMNLVLILTQMMNIQFGMKYFPRTFNIKLAVCGAIVLLCSLIIMSFSLSKYRKKEKAFENLGLGALFIKLIRDTTWYSYSQPEHTEEFTMTSSFLLSLDTLYDKKFEHNNEHGTPSMYFYIEDTRFTCLLTDKELKAILDRKLTYMKMEARAKCIKSLDGIVIESIEVNKQELVEGEQ